MNIPECALTLTDWAAMPASEHPGETGTTRMRLVEIGDLRLRLVEYSPGYLADHWCDRGHIVHVIDGAFDLELQDGRSYRLTAGMSFHVSDFGDAAHRARSIGGAKVFIVD